MKITIDLNDKKTLSLSKDVLPLINSIQKVAKDLGLKIVIEVPEFEIIPTKET